MPRKVDRLLWAKASSRPAVLPSRKVNYRNLKAVGLRFEKAVAQAVKDLRLGRVLHGQWFEFCDVNGHGYCQPDVLLIIDGAIFILECKLTEVDQARAQVEDLYMPVVSMAFRAPTRGIIVARHLTKVTNGPIYDDLYQAMASEKTPLLHWIQRGPIGHKAPAYAMAP